MPTDRNAMLRSNIFHLIEQLEFVQPKVTGLDDLQWEKVRNAVNHTNALIAREMLDAGLTNYLRIKTMPLPPKKLTWRQRLTGKIERS